MALLGAGPGGLHLPAQQGLSLCWQNPFLPYPAQTLSLFPQPSSLPLPDGSWAQDELLP